MRIVREKAAYWAIALAIGTLCACATTTTVAPPSAVVSAPRAAPQALGEFRPRPPLPERRRKLEASAPQLDAVYGSRFARVGATAAVVGIVMDGELVYRGSFGSVDSTDSVRPTVDTSFRIGSLSKSFAATAVLQLRDRGRLTLDEPASRYVRELERVQGLAAGSPPITIRHLLTMTSGLAYDDTWGPVSYGYDRRELEQFFDGGVTLVSQPGERVAYSNLGYALLGLVIERVTQQSFRQYVTRNVLEPLGMTASGWGPPAHGMAVGYHRQDGVLVPEPHPDDGVFAPAGGLYSSLRDFSRYVAFQLAAYADEGPEVAPLLRSTVRDTHRGHAWMRWGHDAPVSSYDPDRGLRLMASSYGFGWVNSTTCDYEGIVQHGGYEPGYYAYVRLLPRHRLGVIAFSTTAALGDYETFRAALSVLKEQGLLDDALAVTPPLRAAQLKVNRLLSEWDDVLARDTFDPGSLQYSWFKSIGADLQRLGREHGQCEPEGELRAGDATQAIWRMRCDRGAIDFSLWLNPATHPRVQRLTYEQYLPRGGAPAVVPALPVPNAPCRSP